jgi:hypothetical protein
MNPHSIPHNNRSRSQIRSQTKIQNLGMPTFRHKDVCRLNVTVDNALSVGCIERVRDLYSEREQRLQLHRTVTDHVLQGLAIQILHGDERLALVLPNLVNGADVRVVQGRGGTCLPAEAFERLRVLSYVLGQKLQSHRTSLAKGEVGIRERKAVPTLVEFCEKRFEPWVESTTSKKTWLDFYRVGLRESRTVGLWQV